MHGLSQQLIKYIDYFTLDTNPTNSDVPLEGKKSNSSQGIVDSVKEIQQSKPENELDMSQFEKF